MSRQRGARTRSSVSRGSAVVTLDASSLSLSQNDLPSGVGRLSLLERVEGVRAVGFNLSHVLLVCIGIFARVSLLAQ